MIPERFPVQVEGVGEFTFRKRRMRDQVWIAAESLRITGGATTDNALRLIAEEISTIARLAVTVPDGFVAEDLDPYDPGDIAKLYKVGGALQLAEDRFRGRAGPAGQNMGPGA